MSEFNSSSPTAALNSKVVLLLALPCIVVSQQYETQSCTGAHMPWTPG